MQYYDLFSKLAPEDKLLVAAELRDEAWYASLNWLEEAEMAHKFKSGDQWSEEEKWKLSLQGRTPMVWNYIHPAVELVMGIHSQNPVRIYPYPVDKSDAFLCEVLEDIVAFIDTNQVDAETEEDTMFENCVITGIGDVIVDVGPDPSNPDEIQLYESALDAYEVLTDPVYKKQNMLDSRHVMYEKWITLEDFKIRYPKHVKDAEEIFSTGTSTIGSALTDAVSRSDNGSTYTDSSNFEYFDSQNKRILVTHLEYREAYKRYYYTNAADESTEIDATQKAEFKKKAKEEKGEFFEIYDTKVKWIHYIHDRILWEGDSPVYRQNFSLCRQIAYVDKSKRRYSYYGLVKLMQDPQRECNRRWMHALRLLASQGVGVMAEIDAFHDLDQADSSWSNPDEITFMAKGGINKVKEKTSLTFPDAPLRMGDMNKQAMKDITGLNPDLQGTAQQRREPGINLKLRQQQGLTMLAKLFKNNKRARKEIFKRKAEIIARYMPDKQIIKILGENEKYAFQDGYIIDQKRQLTAPIRKIRDLQYNIRIEDAPGGLNKMLTELATFLDMMEKKFPVNPETVIDKLDLSPAEKADWKSYITNSQKQQQQAQQQQLDIKKQEMQAKLQESARKLDIEQQKIDILAQGNLTEDERIKLIEGSKLKLNDEVSKRELAVKIAELEASDRANFVEILKWVEDKRTPVKTLNAPPAKRANTEPSR